MRFYFVFFLILTMAIGGSAIAAFAAPPCVPGDTTGTTCGTSSTTASAQVNGGNLSESGPSSSPTASPVTLGINTSTSYSFNLDVNDARGNGNGWRLTMVAGQFTGTLTHNSVQDVLSVDASTLKSVGTTCVSTCSAAGSAQNTGVDLKTSTTIYSTDATTNQGMGDWTITPTVNVAVPANTFAETYTSDVTVSLVAGP